MQFGMRKITPYCFVVLLSLLVVSSAQAITGTISGYGRDYLSTNGCGSDSSYGPFKITLRAGRKWRMDDDSGAVYTGSFTSDSSQRNLVLKLDSSSESRLVNVLKRWGSNLCETNVRIKSHSKPVVTIRFSANFKLVSGKLTMTATGKTAFGSGSAKYTAQFTGATFRGER